MTAPKREIQYLVLPDPTSPYLLARVRWPDVYQAISPVRPDWQDDPGLFDLPYAPNSTELTFEDAAALASEWGAELPSGEGEQALGLSLIRRLPSDWSALSTAERRAWSIVDERPVNAARPAKAARQAKPALPAKAARPVPTVRPTRPAKAAQPVPVAIAAAAVVAWARRRDRDSVAPVAVEVSAVAVQPAAQEPVAASPFRRRQVIRDNRRDVELAEPRESPLARAKPA
jgi:hypothetical protein